MHWKIIAQVFLAWSNFGVHISTKNMHLSILHPMQCQGFTEYLQFLNGGGLEMMVTQFFSNGGFETLVAGAVANLDEQVITIIVATQYIVAIATIFCVFLDFHIIPVQTVPGEKIAK